MVFSTAEVQVTAVVRELRKQLSVAPWTPGFGELVVGLTEVRPRQ